MDQSQPPQTSPQSHTHSSDTHPSSQRKQPVALIAGAVILVVILVIGVSAWIVMSARSTLKSLVQAQVADFEDLEKSYESVRDTLAEDAPIREESADLLRTPPQKISDFDTQVLGAEEELEIHINRKLADNYKKGRATLNEIQTNTTRIAEVYQNPVTKPLLPDATGLITSTKELAQNSDSLLAYLNEINTLEISSKTLGYQIGISLQETIARDADDESVANFKSKVNELNDIFEDFKAIDISGLPEDLQTAHKADIASFSEDTKVFRDIVTAFEERDLLLLQNSFESLIYQSASESTAAEIEVRNFWYEDPTINQASDIKSQWQRFGEDQLGIIF